MRADDAEQTEPRGVRQHAQSRSQPFGGIFIEGCGQQLRATLGVDRLDELHIVILTVVDTSVNVSTHVDARKEV
jgi:hypothetical protein